MSNRLDLVEYEIGDKVKFITPSDLPINITKVNTREELTITNVKDIDCGNGIVYQICDVTDGEAETFATSLELRPSDSELYLEWSKLKNKGRGKRSQKKKGGTVKKKEIVKSTTHIDGMTNILGKFKLTSNERGNNNK